MYEQMSQASEQREFCTEIELVDVFEVNDVVTTSSDPHFVVVNNSSVSPSRVIIIIKFKNKCFRLQTFPRKKQEKKKSREKVQTFLLEVFQLSILLPMYEFLKVHNVNN
jgi:hypothetical protein